MEEKKLLNKVIILVFFVHKKYNVDTWTILMISLLPFWALNMVVVFLSMQDQKDFGFHQKCPKCVLKMNKGLTGFETT